MDVCTAATATARPVSSCPSLDAFSAAMRALDLPVRGTSRFGCNIAYELMTNCHGPDFVIELPNDVPDDVLKRVPAHFDFAGSPHTVFVMLVAELSPGVTTPVAYVLPGQCDFELAHAVVHAEGMRRFGG